MRLSSTASALGGRLPAGNASIKALSLSSPVFNGISQRAEF